MTYDIKTGRTKYVKVGQVRVDGKTFGTIDMHYQKQILELMLKRTNDTEEVKNNAKENADDIGKI